MKAAPPIFGRPFFYDIDGPSNFGVLDLCTFFIGDGRICMFMQLKG